MSKNGFSRPKGMGESKSSPNLYVANCGPAVGLTHDAIKLAFQSFGEVIGVHSADESGVRVIVCFAEITAAQAAFQALNEKPCPNLAGRVLHIRYSVSRPQKVPSYLTLPFCLILVTDLSLLMLTEMLLLKLNLIKKVFFILEKYFAVLFITVPHVL